MQRLDEPTVDSDLADLFDFDSPRGRRPPFIWMGLVLAMLAGVAGGAYWWFYGRTSAPAPTYTTAAVVRGDISVGTTATGPISAPAEIPLSFKTAGQVSQILVQAGQQVTRGQVLAQLDSSDLQRSLAQAQAQLDQQLGALAKLEQGADPAAIITAQTQVEAGTANLASAQHGVAAANAAADADHQVADTAIANAQDALTDNGQVLDSAAAQAQASEAADAQTVANAQHALEDAAHGVDAARAQADAVIAADETAQANAEGALENARNALRVAQQQRDAASPVDNTAIANAQGAVADAQKALEIARQVAGTSHGVQQAQIDKASQDVSAAEANRAAVCGSNLSTRAQCDSARASVDQANAALVVAQTTAKQTAAQNQASLQTSQAQLNQANATLRSDQAAQASDLAHNQGPVQTAQAQVDAAAGSLQAARDALAADQAHQQAAVATSQQQTDQALSTLQAAQATADTNHARDVQTRAQAQQSADQAQATLANAQAQATQTATHSATTLQTAQGQADQAVGQLATLQAQLQQDVAPPTDADLAAARAQVSAAQVALEQARANLHTGTLVAPADGTVAQINGVEGQLVAANGTGSASAPSATAFMTLVDLSLLQVQAQVNESDMAGVRTGNPISFTVSAYPGKTFTGQVLSILPIGSQNQNVVTYTVQCSIDPADVPLLPGMTASLTLVSDSRAGVLLVPAGALQFAQSQGAPPGSVLVIGPDGSASARPLQTGITDGRQTEVISGLQTGEIVATGKPGQ